jgi:formylglycine-generating enzyme required for sulfatase activity
VKTWAEAHGYAFEYSGLGKATNHPIQTVSWYDVVKWCNARSEKAGLVPAYYTNAEHTAVYRKGALDLSNDKVKWNSGYRLPTEAEWEKAARGGAAGHRFPWTDADTITHLRANYYSDISYTYDVSETWGFHPDYKGGNYPHTSPVGSFAPNGYGLYDMAGNVSEWCWDAFDPNYYQVSPVIDPRGPAPALNRVLRGGSWFNFAYYCRVSCRYYFTPGYAGGIFSFRCVQSKP